MADSQEDADKNPQYWEEYSNFQRTKHELIRLYLSGWFGILGSTHGRIVYFDTHAGRGKYHTGEAGSPLVAIRTLLDHSRRARPVGQSLEVASHHKSASSSIGSLSFTGKSFGNGA